METISLNNYMKKNIHFILPLILIGLFLFSTNVNAVPSLNNVRLDIQPRYVGALASWTISFEMPKTTKVGYIEISLGGQLPSLANATLTVSGLTGGHGVVGKTNPSCVTNCDDIKYFFNSLTEVKAGTKIVFTINSVKNSYSTEKTGLSFINVFSSLFPQRTLAYVSTNIFLPLQAQSEEELIPPSATSEGNVAQGIYGVILNDLFYQQGARTTKLSAIKDPTKVSDFTLDLLGKERVTFKGTIDLSSAQAVTLITNLSEHMTFEHLNFSIDAALYNNFKVPLEITYYDVPFVFNPDVAKDITTLSSEKLSNYKFFIIDGSTEVSFIINEPGAYKLIPHFEVYISDNQIIKSDTNLTTFSGRISDPKAIVSVKLNSLDVKNTVSGIEPSTGSFSFAVNLIEGTNLIEVQATSEYGKVANISKIIQFQSTVKQTGTEKKGIDPLNIAAIVLAVIAVIMIWAVRSLSKRKR